MNIFGGNFSMAPNGNCKLRQNVPPTGPQFTSPVRQLGAVPVIAPFPVPAPPMGFQVPQGPNLGVQPPQVIQGPAQAVPAQSPSPIGPQSYKVMKKGEAPCPVCRG